MGATPFLSDLLDAAEVRDTASFPEMFVCAGAPIPPNLIERAVHLHDSRVVSGLGDERVPDRHLHGRHRRPRCWPADSDGRPAGPGRRA